MQIPLYTGGITFYVNKRKFNKLSARFKGEIMTLDFQLLKHYKNDYKIPKIENIDLNMGRKFTVGNVQLSHNSEFYIIRIRDEKIFKKNESFLFELMSESYDMIKNHKDKILKMNMVKANVQI